MSTGTLNNNPIVKRFAPLLVMLGICWVVYGFNNILLHGQLTQYGIRPRHLGGLTGIIFTPFLHASLQHLLANTMPLIILGSILCLRGPGEFIIVSTVGIVLSGALTWLIGRSAYHIGASGLVFCFFGYLASLALFERKIGTLLLSIVCILGYGGIIRGILPTSNAVSWEGHFAGLISGITLAWFVSNVKKANGETNVSTPIGFTGGLTPKQ